MPNSHGEDRPFSDLDLTSDGLRYAERCHSSSNCLLDELEKEQSEAVFVSDLSLLALIACSEDLAKACSPVSQTADTVAFSGYPASPEEIFFGLAIDLLETPEDQRPPHLQFMLAYLANRFDWAELPRVKREIFGPLLNFLAPPHAADELSMELRARTILIIRELQFMAKDVYLKLRELTNVTGPSRPLSHAVWQKAAPIMERVLVEAEAQGPAQEARSANKIFGPIQHAEWDRVERQ